MHPMNKSIAEFFFISLNIYKRLFLLGCLRPYAYLKLDAYSISQ